jgi:four helix bundle protein
MSGPKYNLEERSMEFAVRVIHVSESMKRTPAGTYVADQLLPSGTSPLGHHGEAEGADSRADFIHKLKVCYKELRESRRSFRLVHRTPLVAKPDLVVSLLTESDELVRIFSASISTAEKNRERRKRT